MTEKKTKLVVYLSNDVYEKIMDLALDRAHSERRFRGVISEVVEECARKQLGLNK
jgi:hypothetical protein